MYISSSQPQNIYPCHSLMLKGTTNNKILLSQWQSRMVLGVLLGWILHETSTLTNITTLALCIKALNCFHGIGRSPWHKASLYNNYFFITTEHHANRVHSFELSWSAINFKSKCSTAQSSFRHEWSKAKPLLIPFLLIVHWFLFKSDLHAQLLLVVVQMCCNLSSLYIIFQALWKAIYRNKINRSLFTDTNLYFKNGT